MKDFNLRSRKKTLKWSLIFLLIGVVLCLYELRDFLPIYSYQDLNNTPFDLVEEGPAEIEIIYVWDWFCSLDNDVKRDYFVPGDDTYIAVQLVGSTNDKVYDNLDKIMELEMTNPGISIEEMMDQLDSVKVKGRLEFLKSGEEYDCYMDYLDALREAGYEDLTQSDLEYIFPPVILRQQRIGGSRAIGSSVFAFAAMDVLACLIILIVTLSKDSLKNIKKYCRETGDYEGTYSKFENLYLSGGDSSVKVNSEFILFVDSNKIDFCRVKDVIWFYSCVSPANHNMLQLKVLLSTGKIHEITLAQGDAVRACETLKYHIPAAFEGYSDELFTRFMRDRQSMINEVNSRKAGVII